jgi:hypothetical protein
LRKLQRVAEHSAKALGEFESKQAEAARFRSNADEIATMVADLENIRTRIEGARPP